MKEDTLVSISCITYNHAPYIRECLEGFLMQKTNFKFEVLIHDDASTDGTEEIIREYEAKYPDIIKPLYEEDNQWGKGRRGSAVFNYPRAKGKYIALCEGDDYWTDPLKLQKQVDALENEPAYVLSNTEADVLYQETGYIITSYNKKKKINNYSGEVSIYNILASRYFIKTASTVFRRDILQEYIDSDIYKEMNNYLLMGDTPLWAFMSLKGKFHYLENSTVVYRRSLGTTSNSIDYAVKSRFKLSSMTMRMFYILHYQDSFPDEYIDLIRKGYKKAFFENMLLDIDIPKVFLDLDLSREINRMCFLNKYPFLKYIYRLGLHFRCKIFSLLQQQYYFFMKIPCL